MSAGRCSVCCGPDADACGCEVGLLTRAQVRRKVAARFKGDGIDGERWQRFLAGRVLGLDLDKRGNALPLMADVRHVSRSGMFRLIDLYTVKDHDLYLVRPRWFTTYKQDGRRDGYRVTGCGMDMTFELAYSMFHACLREIGVDRAAWPYQLHLPRVHMV